MAHKPGQSTSKVKQFAIQERAPLRSQSELANELETRTCIRAWNVLESDWTAITGSAHHGKLPSPIDLPGARLVASGRVRNMHVTDQAAGTDQHMLRVFAHDDRVIHVVQQSHSRLVHAADYLESVCRRVEEVSAMIDESVERLQQQHDSRL